MAGGAKSAAVRTVKPASFDFKFESIIFPDPPIVRLPGKFARGSPEPAARGRLLILFE